MDVKVIIPLIIVIMIAIPVITMCADTQMYPDIDPVTTAEQNTAEGRYYSEITEGKVIHIRGLKDGIIKIGIDINTWNDPDIQEYDLKEGRVVLLNAIAGYYLFEYNDDTKKPIRGWYCMGNRGSGDIALTPFEMLWTIYDSNIRIQMQGSGSGNFNLTYDVAKGKILIPSEKGEYVDSGAKVGYKDTAFGLKKTYRLNFARMEGDSIVKNNSANFNIDIAPDGDSWTAEGADIFIGPTEYDVTRMVTIQKDGKISAILRITPIVLIAGLLIAIVKRYEVG